MRAFATPVPGTLIGFIGISAAWHFGAGEFERKESNQPMRQVCFILTSLATWTSAFARPSPPPFDRDWLIEQGDHGVDTSFPRTIPRWIRVHHEGNAQYMEFDSGGPSFHPPTFAPHTTLAIFDSNGILLATSTRPVEEENIIVFGSLWRAGLPGSPSMLSANTFYYIGIGPGGTTFRDGFGYNLATTEHGLVRVSLSPTPGTLSGLLGCGVLALRRRRT